jgi:hypothetical protein
MPALTVMNVVADFVFAGVAGIAWALGSLIVARLVR